MNKDKLDQHQLIKLHRLRFTTPLLVTSILLLGACQPASSAPTIEPPAPPTTPPHATSPAQPTLTPPAPATNTTAAAETGIPLPTATTTPAPPVPATCLPTALDALGPFYTPGAPQRNQVGAGYVLSGVVRSARDCQEIPGAQIDVWMAGPDGQYRDDFRAVFFAAADGSYRFESHFPPPYSGRPPHIHLLAQAPGFQTLVTQHYPRPGETAATFDLVLIPSP